MSTERALGFVEHLAIGATDSRGPEMDLTFVGFTVILPGEELAAVGIPASVALCIEVAIDMTVQLLLPLVALIAMRALMLRFGCH